MVPKRSARSPPTQSAQPSLRGAAGRCAFVPCSNLSFRNAEERESYAGQSAQRAAQYRGNALNIAEESLRDRIDRFEVERTHVTQMLRGFVREVLRSVSQDDIFEEFRQGQREDNVGAVRLSTFPATPASCVP